LFLNFVNFNFEVALQCFKQHLTGRSKIILKLKVVNVSAASYQKST